MFTGKSNMNAQISKYGLKKLFILGKSNMQRVDLLMKIIAHRNCFSFCAHALWI